MKQSYTYEIQPQDVDNHRQSRLYTLENYLLNVAGRAAHEQGYGISQLLPLEYTWIITRLNLELKYLPTHYEQIRIETWVEQNAHMLSSRNYRIYLGDQLIGRAKSLWAVLDLQKREIANVFDLPMFAGSVDGEILEMPKAGRMIPIDNPTGIVPHTVHYSDCDYNGHCNSCKYLERMMDAYHPDVHNLPIRLDINYVKEVHFSDHVSTRFLVNQQGVQYQQIDKDGHTICSAKISILENISF